MRTVASAYQAIFLFTGTAGNSNPDDANEMYEMDDLDEVDAGNDLDDTHRRLVVAAYVLQLFRLTSVVKGTTSTRDRRSRKAHYHAIDG